MTTKTAKKEKPKIETKVPVYNFFDAKEIKKIDLDEKVFDGTINKALIHQAVIMYQATRRAGSASTKTRGEVSGGGKKPWRQKGTGRARAGSIRSPLWRGGGTVFGPHPKDYSYAIPRKIKKLAVKSALNGKLRDSELFLVDDVKMQEPKTKIFAKALEKFLKHNNKKLDLSRRSDTSTMFIVEKPDTNLKRASRNIPYFSLVDGNNFNALDIMLHRNLIVSEDALKKICKRISSN